MVGAHEGESIRRGVGDRSEARFSIVLWKHGNNLRFGSECHGKPFLTSKEHLCLSSSCDHCWGVISPQSPTKADVTRPGPRSDSGRNEAGPGCPAFESWLELDLLCQSRAEERICRVHRALDIQCGLVRLWYLPFF